LSLPFRILCAEKEQDVLSTVLAELYTPLGLRSLAPSDPRYISSYLGDEGSRAASYHQGVVWGWLVGPLVSAYVRVNGGSQESRAAALEYMVKPVLNNLWDCGVGFVSEIFEAEPPYAPRGCIAQAWSVAELLRCYVEDIKAKTP